LPAALHEAEARRYQIAEAARVPLRDGNTLTAVVVQPRRLVGRQPTVLEFTIYANAGNRAVALEAASQGFVGVVATTRGKRGSAGPIFPFESDGADAHDLVDWIARQPWSNGAVGMIGGSYSGFTQWAAAKTRHPALRTIVPTAAVAPGIDFPRENGIVLSFQYAWSRYVGSDGLLDETSYADAARWARIDSSWFARGSTYRALDQIDGAPNALWRRWLDHPAYDGYWQAMIPTAAEFAQIDIPVLSITGYFDGAQPGTLHYYRTHLANRPTADHTLLIGPWDHFGAQRRPSAVLHGLRIDSVANVDVIGVVYAWMAHVLRGAPRPVLLADRVNFQVHGSNHWRHAPSLAAMSTDTLTLLLRSGTRGDDHRLVLGDDPSAADGSVIGTLDVDMADRTQRSSTFIAPGADTTLDRTNGLVFVSEPLATATTLSGALTGTLTVRLNARDVDLAVELYERTADGEYSQLSYHLGRASLARDPGRRTLLVPGMTESFPITGARVTSRVVQAASRLVAVVRVNKNAQSQLNYGSGKDPSDETIADAVRSLQLQLLSGSRLRVPVLR
ncbi:MAG: CocE/NonD family hydrolase, partial [Gemmatimonadaceae bacterium]|nr:CocE/NonD family hydrolase [Gemmatimonadaceae bacterium]